MALSSEDTHVSSLTAPVQETPTVGLPEEPSVTEAELRFAADALARTLRLEAPGQHSDAAAQYLDGLRARLKAATPMWKQGTSTTELTPKLELVESVRMFESAAPKGDSGAGMYRDVPLAALPPAGNLPQVIHIAGSYLAAADGIWSRASLAIFMDQVQKHEPLLLREIQLLPDALKVAQLEFILNRADKVFASGEMPPIERSPFSAPIHSLRRMNQIEWREVLEPLIVFDAALRQDPVGAYAAMEEETRASYRVRVAELARHSDTSELQTAQVALELAQAASESIMAMLGWRGASRTSATTWLRMAFAN
ncbi:MAG: hypothetical protein PW789_07475 [Edaphobacter sp.]|uniref:hypothetical protein n=1 Tax=Edaphobacter sp. TaxID=1934404 RepID=UPI00238C5CFE|nr:hypothetical protein [Edaphobacter sp.]MDE1176435.1 hypothetical protein [Edaphobacter sp.]